MSEQTYPDDVICGECHGHGLEQTDSERDALAWWLSFKCRQCGAAGRVENLNSGVSRYHGAVTTPRRVDLERETAYARDRHP